MISSRPPNYNPYDNHNYCIFCGWISKNVPEDYRCSVCGRSVRTSSRNKPTGNKDTRFRHEGGD